MLNSKVFLLTFLLLALSIPLCHAESWSQVDNSWLDLDSIQVESNGLIKAVAREYRTDETFYSMTLLVDKTNSKYCYKSIECYSMTGKLLGIAKIDSIDQYAWRTYENDNSLIQGIIQGTAER